jgi:two-component system chemotaxis response regulator CheB
MEPFADTAAAPTVRAVVIGGSAGSTKVNRTILRGLSAAFPAPIVVVLHMHPEDGGLMASNLAAILAIPVVEAADKMPALCGRVHVAPAGYHLLVERHGTLALSVDEEVRWSRPSIDVCFDCAAKAWGSGLVAVLLSGANDDGADGLVQVLRRGGRAYVQDPATAAFPFMPTAALAATSLQRGHSPVELADLLLRIEVGAGHA